MTRMLEVIPFISLAEIAEGRNFQAWNSGKRSRYGKDRFPE